MVLRPGQAAILSFAVPGLAHVLLGRPVRGLVAFALTVGAFAAGYAIVGDRLWYMEFMPQTSGIFRHVPVFVLPEFLNFGCMMVVAALRDAPTPDVLRHVLLPRPGEDFALALTGFSGYAAALFAADAWWVARGQRSGRMAPAAAAALTWMVPGSGHFLLGQRSKGLLTGAAVLIVFGLGLFFGGGHSVERSSYTLWWAGQALCGIGALFAALVTAPGRMTEFPESLDLGYVLATCAGLMNLMLMTDAFTIAEESSPDFTAAREASA